MRYWTSRHINSK